MKDEFNSAIVILVRLYEIAQLQIGLRWLNDRAREAMRERETLPPSRPELPTLPDT